MADDQESPQQAETEQQGSGEPAAKPGLRARLPLVGGVVAGLAVGTAGGLLVLGPRLAPSAVQAQGTAKGRAGESGQPAAGSTPERAREGKAGPGEAAPIYMIDNLVLNPAGSGGTRFLLLSVALQVRTEGEVALVKERDAELRDMILRLFGAKTADQVTEASQREGLRAEVLSAVNRKIPGGFVRDVFFPQFVLQ